MRVVYPLPVRPMTSLFWMSLQARMHWSHRMQAWWSTAMAGEESSCGRELPCGSRTFTPYARANSNSLSSPVVASLGDCLGCSLSNSSVSMPRQRSTFSVAVRTTMPSSASRTQEAAMTRAPSTSTAHMRHTPTGRSLGSWHSTGISIPACRAASQIVVPPGTVTWRSSMVRVTDMRGDLLRKPVRTGLRLPKCRSGNA